MSSPLVGLGERIRGVLPDRGAAWLADLGSASPEDVLRKLPERLWAEPDPFRALLLLRDLAAQAGDWPVALGTARAVVAAVGQLRGRTHPDTWFETGALGALLERSGQVDAGVRLLESAREQLAPLGRDLRHAVVAQNLGAALVRAGRMPAAEAPLRAAVAVRRALAPDTVALASAQLGELLQKLGRTAEALPFLEEAHALSVRQEGPEAPRTLARAQLLGVACNAVERYADAARLLRVVFPHLEPTDTERRADVGFELGLALDRSGAAEESVRRIEESVRLTRQVSEERGEPHPALANRLGMMAQLHVRRGRGAEAEGLLLEALDAERRLHGGDSAEVAAQTAQLGHFCYRVGRPQEAVGWMDTATSLVETALGPRHPQTVAVAEAHTALLIELAEQTQRQDPDYARSLLERAYEVGVRILGHASDRTRRARDLLAAKPRR